MVELHLQRTIAAPPDQVFAWLADPACLTVPALVLRAGWEDGSPPPGMGASRKVVGLGVWFREEITAYDPPRSYSYLIRASLPPFNHDGGTLTFTPTGDATQVDWRSSYTHPVRAGGKLLEPITRRLLYSSFEKILQACAAALET